MSVPGAFYVAPQQPGQPRGSFHRDASLHHDKHTVDHLRTRIEGFAARRPLPQPLPPPSTTKPPPTTKSFAETPVIPHRPPRGGAGGAVGPLKHSNDGHLALSAAGSSRRAPKDTGKVNAGVAQLRATAAETPASLQGSDSDPSDEDIAGYKASLLSASAPPRHSSAEQPGAVGPTRRRYGGGTGGAAAAAAAAAAAETVLSDFEFSQRGGRCGSTDSGSGMPQTDVPESSDGMDYAGGQAKQRYFGLLRGGGRGNVVRHSESARHEYLRACEERRLLPEPMGVVRRGGASTMNLNSYGMGDTFAAALGQTVGMVRGIEAVNLSENRITARGAVKLFPKVQERGGAGKEGRGRVDRQRRALRKAE